MIDKMLEKILELGRKSGKVGNILSVVVGFILFMGILGIPATLAFWLLMLIGSNTDSTVLILLSFAIVFPLVAFGPLFLWYKKQEKKDKEKEKARLALDLHLIWKKEEYNKTPHFGWVFGPSQTKELLKDEVFNRYTFESGKKAFFVRVSESGKWFSFLGGILPLDLIVGYDRKKSELYTLDGYTIELPSRAVRLFADAELERFFKERGHYYTTKPEAARTEYFNSYKGSEVSLSKADWGKIRYSWEKAMANDSDKNRKKNSKKNSNKKSDELFFDPSTDTDIFERVLSDREMQMVFEAVKSGKTKLSRFLDFGLYKTDQSVCNCIELLEQLCYPRNLEGCDFLFECLRDVDEPYFFMAAELLKTYPRKLREEKIEEYAAKAHESGNVEKFAGVLYLAKELDYEIKYVQKMKEKEDESNGKETLQVN